MLWMMHVCGGGLARARWHQPLLTTPYPAPFKARFSLPAPVGSNCVQRDGVGGWGRQGEEGNTRWATAGSGVSMENVSSGAFPLGFVLAE